MLKFGKNKLGILIVVRGKYEMQIEKDKSRKVTKKDIITALFVAGFLIFALIIGEFYSKIISGILVGIILLVAIVQYLRVPKEEKAKIARAIEEHDKTFIGRAIKISHYGLYLALIVGIVLWLLNEIK